MDLFTLPNQIRHASGWLVGALRERLVLPGRRDHALAAEGLGPVGAAIRPGGGRRQGGSGGGRVGGRGSRCPWRYGGTHYGSSGARRSLQPLCMAGGYAR